MDILLAQIEILLYSDRRTMENEKGKETEQRN